MTWLLIGITASLVVLLGCAAVDELSRDASTASPRILAGPDSGLGYVPTGEFVFPSVLDSSRTTLDTPARYLLYYAPHEPPGGISVMYADTLEGPWTEYVHNPVLEADWSPFYTVTHVSSPDAVWDAQEERLLLYFHGENDTIRIAESSDGIHFDYLGTALVSSGDEEGVTESSYARVIPAQELDPRTSGFTMLFMDKREDTGRRIRVADSPDGMTWSVRPEPLISPGGVEGDNLSGANLWVHGGRIEILYHSSTGQIWRRSTDTSLTETSAPCVFFEDSSGIRTAAPEPVEDDEGRTWLFFERGNRLTAEIAVEELALDRPNCLE